MNEFSKCASSRRAEKHMTQQQVAELAGISLRQYQDIEAGRGQPRLSTAVQIAAALDIDLNSLKNKVTL